MSFCFRIVHRTRFDLNRHSTSPPCPYRPQTPGDGKASRNLSSRVDATRLRSADAVPCWRPGIGRPRKSNGIPNAISRYSGYLHRPRFADARRYATSACRPSDSATGPAVDARTSCTRRRRDSSAPRGLGHARIAIAAPPARSVDARACTRGGRARERTAHVALPVMRGTPVRPRRMPGFGTRRRGSGRSSQRRVHVRRDSLLSLSDARRRRRRALLHVGQHLAARQ